MAQIINITNGTGTGNVSNGTYDVTANAQGYDSSTINPDSVTIAEGTNTYAFTIVANGTLTLHVTETGTEDGTPVVGATFVRTDAEGNEYGNPVTSDADGNAVFENMPYSSDGTTIVYFKQTASDGNHEFFNEVKELILALENTTAQIINPPITTRTFTLTDANYEGLPIPEATLTLTPNE